MRLNCLLIDDEPPALKILTRYINDIGGMEIVGLCANAIEALEVLRRNRVDVIFLDIKMPRMLGTDFLRNLTFPPKIIFVTAYREYAVDGFELDAVDYLVKPVSFDRFVKAVTKLNRLFVAETIKVEETSINEVHNFIYLKVEKEMRKIFINDIFYIESLKDYIKVFFNAGKYLLVKQSISNMEKLLSPHHFLRVHRSFIISMNKVSGYNNTSVLLADVEIPIGRLYKQVVMEHLQNH
jgi:DNA-binding LytR/AlgR family response regulator